MNNELKLQIVSALDAYLSQYNISQNELAAKCGVNVAYISSMLKNKFEASAGKGKMVTIAPKWFIKIAEFIGFSMEKSFWGTVPTEQMKHLLAVLQDAKQYAYTNVIIGETGCGKTYVVNLFAKHNPTDVFVVTVSSSDNLGDLLEKTVEKLKIRPAVTKSKKIRDIAAYMRGLKEQGRRPVLIFDESEYMKQPVLCTMKELYDGLNGHCAIVLIGTDQLLQKIDKMRKKNKAGIPQFYRRIKFGIRVLPPIDRSFKQFLNGLDTALKNFLQDNCDNYGELHDVLVPAMREAERTGEPITEQFVRKILGMAA